MRRREFIIVVGAAAWPLAARAQQGDRVRRIGVLMPGDETDPVRRTSISAFIQALAALGWTDGRNVRMDLRWYGDDNNRSRTLARELVGLQPDIIDHLVEKARLSRVVRRGPHASMCSHSGPDRRGRALTFLKRRPDGRAETLMVALGFSPALLKDLIRAGLVTAKTESAGRQTPPQDREAKDHRDRKAGIPAQALRPVSPGRCWGGKRLRSSASSLTYSAVV
jgi:hypothetical protein